MSILEQGTHCSWEATLNFCFLTVVRGTTPLMMFFAMYYLHSASLVVAIKCGISVILFSLSALFLLQKSDVRATILNNLQEKSTYFKLLLVGFLQSAVPYLLIAYSVKYIPITIVGVYMVITPWWIHIIECSPIIRNNKRFPTVLKIGMIIGIVGIIIMIIPVLVETSNCVNKTKLMNNTNITSSNILQPKKNILVGEILDYCHPMKDVFNGLVAIAVVPILWAIAAVFWKKYQGNIHFVVSSIGQNAFGGIIATIVWLIFGVVTNFKPINWNENHWIKYVLYLGVATGWLGTLLVRNLFSKLGSKTINQVLTGIPLIVFIENCVFIRDTVTRHSYMLIVEMLGLILVTVGVFISNIPSDNNSVKYSKSRGNLSEPLIDSEYPSDGLNAGLEQILRNQIHQYEQNPDIEENENGGNDAEEPIFPSLDPDIKVNYPILTEVS